MVTLLNIITLQKLIAKSSFPKFYEQIIKEGLYGYLSIKDDTIIGIYQFAPQDKKQSYKNLKQKFPFMFENGVWGT